MLIILRNSIFAIGIITLSILSPTVLDAAELDLPFPQNTEVILWVRPELVSGDAQLKDILSQSRTVGYYLDILNLSMEQVEYAVIFMPYDPSWLNKVSKGAVKNLPTSGAIVIKSKIDPAAKYREMKSSGWREEKHVNKKLLWWSTGETYLINKSGNECLAKLGDDRFIISGSTESMKLVLDVAGNKAPGIESIGVFEEISMNFFENNLTVASAFIKITDSLRKEIKANAGEPQSAIFRMAVGYIDNAQEVALSVKKSAQSYLLDGYIGMDSGNNAIVVTGVLQAGGSLAGLMEQDNPGRELLENLSVTRNERIIELRTHIPEARLVELFGGRR
jgi:hypothetical protein